MISWLAAGSLVGGVTGTLAYGIAGKSSQLFGDTIYRGKGLRRSIALTWDDGPSPATELLLEYLDRENIRGTFFQCGMNVERYPQLAQDVAAQGHEIGNHTFSHPRLCPSWGRQGPIVHSPQFVKEEFARTQQILAAHTGVTPTLARAPYGLRWFGVGAAQRELGLLGVLWTVIGHDWDWPSIDISRLVLQKAAPGGIVCLHDGRDIQAQPDVSHMLASIRQIVPVLKDAGYTFETVSEMIERDREGPPQK